MDGCPQRKQLRLPDYDYSQNGAYFVTVCTKNKAHLFGAIVGAGHPAGPNVELSSIGIVVDRHIRSIPQVYPGVFVDSFVVMPNHIHLLLRFDRANGPAGCPAPTGNLPKLVGALKSLCSRDTKVSLWQRGYYEHIIRNQDDYLACLKYIDENPEKWLSS